MNELEKLRRDPVSRRAFLARAAAAGIGAAALALIEGCGSSDSINQTSIKDPNFRQADGTYIVGRNINEVVLNYVLTFKTMEADLYRQAVNRAAGVSSYRDNSLIIDPAKFQIGSKISTAGLDNPAAAFHYLVQFAYAELTHRDYLRLMLVALNAPLANGNQRGYTFPASGANALNDPGPDLKTILTNVLKVEETGVRGLLGALPFMKTSLGMQDVAAINSTEARHAAALSYSIGLPAGPAPGRSGSLDQLVTGSTPYPHPNTFEYYLVPNTVMTAIDSAYYVKA